MPHRPDLVPAELRAAWVDAGHTPGVDLRTLFDEQVERHPDKVAVVDDEKSTTYAEIAEMADRIAGLLSDWGIRPGEVVAIQLPNVAEACAADLAVATLGAICLPYPVLYRHNEVRSLLGPLRGGGLPVRPAAARLRLRRPCWPTSGPTSRRCATSRSSATPADGLPTPSAPGPGAPGPAAAPPGGGRRPLRPGPDPRHLRYRGGAQDGAVLPRRHRRRHRQHPRGAPPRRRHPLPAPPAAVDGVRLARHLRRPGPLRGDAGRRARPSTPPP